MENTLVEYEAFIERKLQPVQAAGFEPKKMKVPLWEWQKELTAWAIRKGRAALFEDCGLGKTRQQI